MIMTCLPGTVYNIIIYKSKVLYLRLIHINILVWMKRFLKAIIQERVAVK